MKIPKSLYNWISLLGIIISINCALLIVALFIISLSSETSSAYLGLYIYIILPTLLVLGLIMVLIGMLIKRREKHDDEGSSRRWPLVDLNNPRQRRSLSIVSVSALVFLVVSAMGSYQAFQYSESVSFCGKLCHEVMKPEYITYLHSPHARVRCVDCHVGEGADWYVKSKLSGLYQLYAVTFNVFPRPIPTPVKCNNPAVGQCFICIQVSTCQLWTYIANST